MTLILEKFHRRGEHRGSGDIFKSLMSMQKMNIFHEVTSNSLRKIGSFWVKLFIKCKLLGTVEAKLKNGQILYLTFKDKQHFRHLIPKNIHLWKKAQVL
ncbi:hypothetical protein WA026_010786 [Henosepilachna vigintioctopunctata]|uniref:Uncharacterized protein n=1 Tax=Henosepilachna vigintioctopunctata TaxID=420089 RepID=A0AAW1UXS0_9CUCU